MSDGVVGVGARGGSHLVQEGRGGQGRLWSGEVVHSTESTAHHGHQRHRIGCEAARSPRGSSPRARSSGPVDLWVGARVGVRGGG